MGRYTTQVLLLVAFAIALLFASASPAAGFGFITKWGSHGKKAGQFVFPPDVATDRSGNVYVTDGDHRVQKFTPRGAFITQWEVRRRNGRIGHPWGIATDRDGNVYVADILNHKIEKFTAQGRFISEWGHVGTGRGKFVYPTAVATDRVGNVYVADKGNGRIEKFTSAGRFLSQWGSPGFGAGQLAQPTGIATDGAGNVFVAEGGSNRISKFTSTGDFLLAWGDNVGGPGVDVCTVICTAGDGIGKADNGVPFDVAASPAGQIFVSDGSGKGAWAIKAFTPEGAYLGEFGPPGNGNGQFRTPSGLAFDDRGNLYVLDLRNSRVQKFGEPSSTFSLNEVRRHPRRGTARLNANVPGVGRLIVAGTGIRDARRRAGQAGEIALPVVPVGGAREKLRSTGRVTVKVEITYTPTTVGNAVPATRSRRLTLVRADR